MPQLRLLLSLSCAFLALSSHGQIITTVAGIPPPPFIQSSGDGGPAVDAHIGDMYHGEVAFDAIGDMYIPENSNNTIRMVNVAGIITTIAGTGTLGYSGDGGPAITAAIYHPGPMIVDNAGNIIFADQVGTVLRKIDPSGIITTISAPYISACAGEGVPLSKASFNEIDGLAKDNAGNIYVSDQACHTVRKISTSGIVTTVAGNGTYGFSGDGGPATAARLNYPCQVGIDNAGNIYIPDSRNHRIRKVSTSGIITTIGGDGSDNTSGDGGPASAAEFAFPASVCVDNSDNIYVAEAYGYAVRKIDHTGIVTDYAGNYTSGYSGDGGPATLARMTEIENIALDAAGNIYIVDYDNQVIRKVINCLTASFSLQPNSSSLCKTGNPSFTVAAANNSSLQWQINSSTDWVDLADNGVFSGSSTSTLRVRGADLTMNNNQFRCVANNSCGKTYSLTATLTVAAPTAASVLINTGTPAICPGVNTTFQAVPTNGGTAPDYQWQKNGVDVGWDSPDYSDAGLGNGDIIACIMTSNSTCLTTSSATSNAITMTVNPVLTASISIAASANDVCAGTVVTFTADPVNQGTGPSYQWYKNGSATGTNSPSYNDNTLQDGDVISCQLTSAYSCLTAPTASSNSVTMDIVPLITPSISVSTPGTAVCEGSPVVFSASVQNGGTVPVYQWQKNGAAAGANTPDYTDDSASTGDLINCVLTSDASCLTAPSATSNVITVAASPNPAGFLPSDTVMCTNDPLKLTATAGYRNYLWSNNSSGESITVTQPGLYWLEVTDNNNCVGRDTIDVGQKDCLTGFYIPNAFTPNNDGKNDNFKPILLGNINQYQFTIFNRWGQSIFQSTTPAQGWDGTLKGDMQPSGTFVWICTYQLAGSPVVTKKGTVILIR